MKPSALSGNLLRLILLLPPLFLLAAGCAGRAEEKGRTYTVRAQVEQLPSEGGGLSLRHEAIDDWVGYSGEVEGMDSMTMPFPVAEGVSLKDLQPGDIVEAEVHVDWEADLAVQITALRELPPGTRLEFRTAVPPPKT